MVALVKVREDHLGVVNDEDANAQPDHRRDGREDAKEQLESCQPPIHSPRSWIDHQAQVEAPSHAYVAANRMAAAVSVVSQAKDPGQGANQSQLRYQTQF